MPWFGKKKPAPIRSLVCEGTVVQGNLRFVEGLRIDGEVQGDVTCDGERSLLVISEKARVCGKVKAGHVIISGEVRGPITALELLELQPGARVTGDVRYELLEMHQGAMVEGELRPLKSTDKPALKLAASNDA
ncbi:MAG: polymer-forming cytoskeletal protein [Rubrivivax sp.]|nr:polymer-forming cytoskeletal protein [Rubrivivax sp.]